MGAVRLMSENRVKGMLQALDAVDALTIGEAKKLRLRALVKTLYLKGISYDLADLAKKSREEIVSIRIKHTGKNA